MTFRELRNTIGWTVQHIATCLGVNERTVRRWDSGEFVAPATVMNWMQLIADFIKRNPPPRKGNNDAQP